MFTSNMLTGVMFSGLDNKMADVFKNTISTYTQIDKTMGFPIMGITLPLACGFMGFQILNLVIKPKDIGSKMNKYKIPEIATIGTIIGMLKILTMK